MHTSSHISRTSSTQTCHEMWSRTESLIIFQILSPGGASQLRAMHCLCPCGHRCIYRQADQQHSPARQLCKHCSGTSHGAITMQVRQNGCPSWSLTCKIANCVGKTAYCDGRHRLGHMLYVSKTSPWISRVKKTILLPEIKLVTAS